MAAMFKPALQRMAGNEWGQILAVPAHRMREGQEPESIRTYELQWVEREPGVLVTDPLDVIICKYRLMDDEDIKRVRDALERRQGHIQAIAKDLM